MLGKLVRALTVSSDLALPPELIVLSMSMAGLAIGYFFAPSLLPVLRCTMACTLIALALAKNPALFNQNYNEVWLPLFQDRMVRIVVRAAVLVTAATGLAVAFFGARQSFGLIWKTAIARALALFLVCLAGYVAVYVLSPGYVLSGYAERLAPFAIFFLVFIPTVAVCALSVAGHRCWTWFLSSESQTRWVAGRIVVPMCVVFAIATTFLLWTRVQTYYASVFPPNHAAFAKSLSLPPFAGSSFGVNNYAAVVAYYTKNWAYIDGLLATP